MPTLTIQTNNGPRDIAAVWQGQHLAVHKPLKDGAPSTAPRRWTVTHVSTGLAAWPTLDVAKPRAVELAKLWDAAFAPITAAGDAKGWQWAKRWADDVGRALRDRPLIGPRELTPLEAFDSAGTAAECEAAVSRAMGYEPMDDSEASEQWPAELTRKQTGSGAVRRNPESGELEFWWLPQGGNYPDAEAVSLAGWYPVPYAGDVERWCLGSLAETPCGDRVEPDHPDAWPRLLGLI